MRRSPRAQLPRGRPEHLNVLAIAGPGAGKRYRKWTWVSDSFARVLIVLVERVLGSTLPVLTSRLGADPLSRHRARGSPPFVDAVGLRISLSLADWLVLLARSA